MSTTEPGPPDHFAGDVAAHYDDDPTEVRWTPDHLALESGFLAELAGAGGRALELAIGTGRIALPLRERGIEVHGIDLSADMVAQLRAKPGGADVPVTLGDYTTAEAAGPFDLVYLVFNTISNVTSQDAQVATFANAARHLRPGGHFVAENGVPSIQQVPYGERFHVYHSSADRLDYDEYDVVTQDMWSHHVRFGVDGAATRASIPFRYAWPAELDLMARLAGLALTARYAWWDRAPLTATSGSHVSVWQRS